MGNFYSQQMSYVWKRDDFDKDDIKVSFSRKTIKKLPSKVDLRTGFGKIYNSAQLGSCTATAICESFMYDQKKQNLKTFEPSRLFLYYNEKENSIRDGIKSINKLGICEETSWPYTAENFNKKPTDNCYDECKFQKCIKYRRIRNKLEQMKAAISKGYPFVFGFSVYASFESPSWDPSTQIMPIPTNDEKLLGGHAVVAVGYSDKKKCFLIRNSWGSEWGIDGNFLMSYDFITSDECDDFWIIETISSKYKKKENLSEKEYKEEKVEDYDDLDYGVEKTESVVKKTTKKAKKEKSENQIKTIPISRSAVKKSYINFDKCAIRDEE
jgi:C1A family cysteine protease